jgi:5-methyltetrahydrofolate--homocysteine methyltransferase
LKEGGADALVIETMSDLAEAKIALAAARQTGLPVVACVVFDSGKNKDRTMMGNTPEQAAAELTEAGADVIGANCGVGIAAYVPICTRLKANTDKPVWIKANAGLPEIVDGRTIWKTSPEEFSSFAPALIEAGANFLGGCCGTRPEFIAATLKALGR